jgi:hypothetical protein
MLLNRKLVKNLRAVLDDALNDNESFEQFIVEVGSANFSDTEVTFKVNLRIKGAKSQSEKELEDWAGIYKLDLNKVARLDGKEFKLSGYRRRARKKPFLIKDLQNGGEYIISDEIAKKYFGKDISLSDKPIGA